MLTAWERDGFVLAPDVATPVQIQALIAALEEGALDRSARRGQTFGARNLLEVPAVQAFAKSQTLARLLTPFLGAEFCAVRGLFFDKTEGANWPVLWHQDLSIAVSSRCDRPGWCNWSVKRGVLHVQPPPAILVRMLTLRLHLDACAAENGPLRVIAGSHARGTLSRGQIQTITAAEPARTVTAEAGDALLMRPMLLHASSPALRPSHRRVLHLEFAPKGLLPNDLEWAAA